MITRVMVSVSVYDLNSVSWRTYKLVESAYSEERLFWQRFHHARRDERFLARSDSAFTRKKT